jgi:hypothetical protein
MLKYGEANPLTVFGLRKLDHCPPHFVRVDFELRTSQKVITDWIWTNLSGRFWYGDWYHRNDDKAVHFTHAVGFEIPGEASMFALMLDTINNHDFLIG